MCISPQTQQFCLIHHDGTRLFAAFQPYGLDIHCLWALTPPASPTTNYVTVIQHWTLGGRVCSVAADWVDNVYLLFCNTNYFQKPKYPTQPSHTWQAPSIQGSATEDFARPSSAPRPLWYSIAPLSS